ncbi:phosphotransferase-like protein [Sulfitobacter aestuariivivens]|uniref:phosphotransferase-like protein n=1 Tax=Sulfitobacter aestuariivivens TaxID=2766981 RepID=UPI00361D085C
MHGHIIILNGPSSSGKSTTAAALQDLAAVPFWHISIDHLRDSGVLPNRRMDRGISCGLTYESRFSTGFTDPLRPMPAPVTI